MGRRQKYKASDDTLALREGLLAIAASIERLAAEVQRATGAIMDVLAPEVEAQPLPETPAPRPDDEIITIQPASE